jgi:hypothetical protein
MSTAERAEIWDERAWRQAAAEYHKGRAGRTLIVEIEPQRLARLRELMADNVSLERAWAELNEPRYGAAESTIEAVAYALREDGDAALQREWTRERLGELSVAQLERLIARLTRAGASETLLLILAELLP